MTDRIRKLEERVSDWAQALVESNKTLQKEHDLLKERCDSLENHILILAAKMSVLEELHKQMFVCK